MHIDDLSRHGRGDLFFPEHSPARDRLSPLDDVADTPDHRPAHVAFTAPAAADAQRFVQLDQPVPLRHLGLGNHAICRDPVTEPSCNTSRIVEHPGAPDRHQRADQTFRIRTGSNHSLDDL